MSGFRASWQGATIRKEVCPALPEKIGNICGQCGSNFERKLPRECSVLKRDEPFSSSHTREVRVILRISLTPNLAMAPLPNPDSQAGELRNAPTTVTVLFADVAGSTKLYEALGDKRAKRVVDECIELMRSVVEKHGGRVVKTIGDEVMCVLSDAENGCLAAMDMQVRIAALSAASNIKRAIRIGLHFGPVIEENNDVFGDTVNLAARMAGLAKGAQIFTTRGTVDHLSRLLQRSIRNIAALSVKGKADDVQVCEVIWLAGDELTMATPSILTSARETSLVLRYGGTELVVRQTNASIILGRDASCQIAVADRMASRQHAHIERRRDKFFLVDQSTNGTFVVFLGEPEIVLRREEVMLRGQGSIAFGRSVEQAQEHTVEFLVRV